MSEPLDHDEESPGFLRRHGVAIGIASVLLGGIGAALAFMKGGDTKPAPKKTQEFSMVRLTPPPPPPPPPPPKPAEPKEEKEPVEQEEAPADPMIEQDPVANDEPPAAEAAASAPADEAMGTSIQGDGSDGFGLAYSKTGGGNTIGGTGTGGTGTGALGGNGSRWGRYAARIQTSVTKALADNPATRAAAADIRVRVWADPNGRITRVALVGTTGDAELDDALHNRVLVGLHLGEAPPSDMPMPIVMRIAGRRP